MPTSIACNRPATGKRINATNSPIIPDLSFRCAPGRGECSLPGLQRRLGRLVLVGDVARFSSFRVGDRGTGSPRLLAVVNHLPSEKTLRNATMSPAPSRRRWYRPLSSQERPEVWAAPELKWTAVFPPINLCLLVGPGKAFR
jgi:hypothetical protein